MLSENSTNLRQLVVLILKNLQFSIRPEDGAVFQQSLLKVKTNGEKEMKLHSDQVYKEMGESDASSALTPS